MNYTYEIARIEPKQGFMRVVYTVAGSPSIHQTFADMTDFSEAGIIAAIEARAPVVARQLDRYNTAPETPALTVGHKGSKVWQKPVPQPPHVETPEEQLESKLAELGRHRKVAETGGIVWTAADGKTYGFDTDVESQAKFTAAVAQAKNKRKNTDVWKCAEFDEVGNQKLVFRKTTNAEMEAISDAVFEHIQKCFNVEAACVDKALAGDLTVDFGTEFRNS